MSAGELRGDAALQTSERRLSLAQQALGFGIWDWDLVRQTIDWSPEMYAILGLDPVVDASDPYAGWLRVMHPDDCDEQDQLARDSALRGEEFSRSFRIVRPGSGEIRWIRTDATVVRDPDGRAIRMVGVNLDVTDQQRAAEALHESQAELRLITDSLPELISFVDRNGKYRFANKAYEDWYGQSPAEIVGRDVRSVLGEEAFAFRRPYIESALAGQECSLDVEITRVDGRVRCGEARYLPHRDETGAVDGFYAYVIDITERKKAEDALQRLNEKLEAEVEERTRDLRQAEEALRQAQKMEAIGQLTGGIAHDFNNMLGAVLGGLDLIRRRMAAQRYHEVERYVELASVSAQRAAALTQRLLAFARRQSLERKRVDVNVLTLSMEELLRRSIGADMVLRLDLEPTAWPALTDANQVESALLNLTINARDAMPDGGTLTIATGNVEASERGVVGEFVVLSVSDTGQGMDKETLSRAFDPFFTTKPIGAGTGLGLSMVYGFAQQTGGQVTIESEPKRGTTVRLYLPRSVQGPSLEDDVPPKRRSPVQHGTILVVEDEPALRALVVEHLRDLGFTVHEASEAAQALPLLRSRERVDLLLSDVGLPGMNGRQLADLARESRPELNVLFMTGFAEGARERSGFLLAGMDLLTKPFAMDELAAKVLACLDQPVPAARSEAGASEPQLPRPSVP